MEKRLELAKRKAGKEQYYTRPKTVKQCVELSSKYIDKLTVLEPSAGTGEFINQLTAYNVVGLDIEPKHPAVSKQDFFEFNPTEKHFFTIGNPPFGRNHSLSVRFFNHAAEFSDYIAFIIPKSWRKWSVQNRLDNRFHLVEDLELDKDIFYDENGEGFGSNFNAVFQIWEKREELRPKIVVKDNGYITRCTPEEADVALVYAGYSAGRVETTFERVKNTTKIYLKAKPEIIKILQELDYSRLTENVAFTPVFGLQEVNFLLNERKTNEI